MGSAERPEKITMGKSGSNKSALDTINKMLPKNEKIGIRQIKYLNNIVEQDHRFIKKIVKPMLCFKAMHSEKATLAGIELHHMLKKQQHKSSANQTISEPFYALAV
jgi:putative transposase